MEPNELSLTPKITFLLTLVFRDTNYKITPFKHLMVTEGRRGHPYMSDIILSEEKEVEVENNSITVAHSEELIMLVEVKKSISLELSLVDPSTVIEMLLYVQYLLMMYKQSKIIGAITDGSTWHCFNLEKKDDSHLLVKKYAYIKDHDVWSVNNVPELLKCLKDSN